MELVYFAFPSCDANCTHCWSHNMLMGRVIPIEKHYSIIDRINIDKYSNIKISGGEPFLNTDLSSIVFKMRGKWGSDIPITIFTSGRQIFDTDRDAVERNIVNKLRLFDNISLEVSVDEYHVDVLREKRGWGNSYIDEMRILLTNYFDACMHIKETYCDSFSFRFKMHCAKGRKQFHEEELYSWMPQEWWDKYIIITEGLACAGNAKGLSGTFHVEESDMMSHFLLPGVSFQKSSEDIDAEMFFSKDGEPCYLSLDLSSATVIKGWWNIIDRVADYYVIRC